MSAPTSVYHPLFSKWISAWQDCRNAFDGQRAIKNAGTRYLPQLTGQEDEDYKAYKERALFFSITGKTISALVGMALGRAPIFKAPERMKEYGLDEWGIQIVEMICNCLTEVLLTGRYGLMLDMPEQGGDPYLARYPAENIINWSVDRQGRPTRVVLQEVVYEESDNSLGTQQREIEYRTLFINAAGVYQVDVYDDSYKNIKKSTVPTVNGMALTEIPFIIMNPIGIGWDIIKPPVLDIVDINISHYRTSADLEHGRHFTALPTPVVSGVDAASVLRIGSQTAWVLPEATAKAYYLEFQGLGLKSLETALQEKQSQLASLSARLLDNSGNGSEAVDAVRLRYMSETASLLMVVLSVEDGLNAAYKLIAQFLGEDPSKVSIKLNREFLSTKLSAAEVVALTKQYNEGAISKEAYIYNLRRGDMLPPDRTDAQEIAALPEPVKPAAKPATGGGLPALN